MNVGPLVISPILHSKLNLAISSILVLQSPLLPPGARLNAATFLKLAHISIVCTQLMFYY